MVSKVKMGIGKVPRVLLCRKKHENNYKRVRTGVYICVLLLLMSSDPEEKFFEKFSFYFGI